MLKHSPHAEPARSICVVTCAIFSSPVVTGEVACQRHDGGGESAQHFCLPPSHHGRALIPSYVEGPPRPINLNLPHLWMAGSVDGVLFAHHYKFVFGGAKVKVCALYA